MSDAHVPAFLDRCSVLPIDRLADVVREFCRSGDGARPAGTAWVVAVPDNGLREDRAF